MKRLVPGRRGFSLIELMIGLAISIIVMAALIEVFSNQQKVYSNQSQLTKEEQAARTAMAMLSRDVRMAGYTGVPLGNDLLVDTAATSHYFPIISLFDGATSDVKTTSGAAVINYTGTIITALKAAKVTSDAIEIRGNFLRATTTLAAPVMVGAANLPVTDPSLFSGTEFNRPGWIVVGQTGSQVKIQIYPISGPPAGNNVPIGLPTTIASDTADIIVAPLYSRVYYATPDDASLKTGRRKLWVANYVPTADNSDVVMAGQPQEFAVDIDKFQIHYELDQGLANQLTLGQSMICDPCQVRNVNLNLWTAPDPNKYNNVPADLAKRLQSASRKFTASVRVRNAGFDATSCAITPQPCAWGY
jgi:prepilin-type N-terminal cleavage/methylation domain-containing protein